MSESKTKQTKFVLVKSERKDSIYSVGSGSLLVYLGNDINVGVALDMITLKDKLKPETCRVVFRENGFKSDSDRINTLKTLEFHGIDSVITI